MKSSLLHLKEVLIVNKKLTIAVGVALAVLMGLTGHLQRSQLECLGVADAQETRISFETPVIVKRIFVIPGQNVVKGQPLIEVEPQELNIRMLEVQTELDSLQSELEFRRSLLETFSGRKKEAAKQELESSPVAKEVDGLRRQYEELKRLQSQAIKFAEADGVVATVNYRVNEQVPPFDPIMTLSSSVPSLVYGFIHEDRLSDFQVGDSIQVESISESNRSVRGKVISLGRRITLFPLRLQNAFGHQYWGRELVVALPDTNNLFMGEKVRIHASGASLLSDFNFQAIAEEKVRASDPFLKGLKLEAGGAILLADGNLLVASDDDGPSGSPFWLISQDGQKRMNLVLEGVEEGLLDIESLVESNGHYYALSSLRFEKDSNTPVQPQSGLFRFQLAEGKVVVDRSLDIQEALIDQIAELPVFLQIRDKMEDFEIEALGIEGEDAFVALKEPQLKDGSSLILRVKNLISHLDSGGRNAIETSIASIVFLKDSKCSKPSRVTDLIKESGGFTIVSNCGKKESVSQVWWIKEGSFTQQPVLLKSLNKSRLEAIAHGNEPSQYFLGSDGGDEGSDFYKTTLQHEM